MNRKGLDFGQSRQWPSLLDIPLSKLTAYWPQLVELLGTRASWPFGIRPGFLPDFGLMLRKTGLDRIGDQKTFQMFESMPVQFIAKLEDNLYSLSSPYRQEFAPNQFTESMVTFEFGDVVYQSLLAALPQPYRDAIEAGLKRQPYKVLINEVSPPLVMAAAELGDVVHSNPNESYCPFIAERFLPQPKLG